MPDAVEAQPAIETQQLTCDFGGRRAVDGLDLRVPRGSVFGFLGPNGAGKSTTVRLLLGLLTPTGGTARVLGMDTRYDGDRIRGQVGVVLEHPGLYERLTAEENLEFYRRVYGLPAGDGAVRRLLGAFGLWDRRREVVGGWSRGMRQKLALVRALLHEPPLVFLDEPTAGLDPLAAHELRGQLIDLADRRATTLFLVTHNLVEAEELCQQVGVIHHGRLLAVGPPAQLRAGRADGGRTTLEQAFVSLLSQGREPA